MIKLSVVVIGLNEGPLLTNCFQSILDINDPPGEIELIYVDSASEDDSIERAHQCGAKVINLKDCKPTAALARNMGWQAAQGEYILFLDGDTTLDPAFASKALSAMRNPQIGVVSGQIQEKRPEKSLYNRIFDIDWKIPSGIVEICGGNALIRRDVLKRVNGFNNALKAGEEPEMCQRIKAAGYSIVSLEIPMAAHDLDMHSLLQYWKRCMRTGYAYASVSHLMRKSLHPLWQLRARHNLIKTSVFFIWLITALYYAGRFQQFLPLLLLLVVSALLIFRTAYKLRETGVDRKTALAYGVHSHFQHIPMFFGQISFWLSKIRPF